MERTRQTVVGASTNLLKIHQAFLAHSVNPIVYLDRDFNFLLVNQAYADTCHRAPEEFIGKNHFDLYPNEENQAIFARVRDTGEPVTFYEKPFVFPGQPERGVTYWDWTLTPIKEQQGYVEGLVFSLKDMTDQVLRRQRINELAAEIALREERYRALFENIQSAFALCEVICEDGNPVDYRYIEVNAAFEKHTGKKPAELRGRLATEVLPGVLDDPIHPIELFGRVALTGQSIQFEHFAPVFNRWVSVYVYRPQLNHFALVFNDVTTLKQLEAEREKNLKELARANEAKDMFFNVLAHEIRTPLAAILNAVEVLQNPSVSAEKQQRSLEIVQRNVLHQSRLINDLLEQSRIMRGKVQLNCQTIDLREVAHAQLNTVTKIIGDKKLQIHVELGNQPLLVHGDAERLGQVIANLITNAAKFTEVGGEIALRGQVQKNSVLLSVKDNGIGISPQLLPKLFEPFVQGEGNDIRAKHGLGLGLPISRALVEQHGGELTVFSEGPRRGSEFTVTLPFTPSVAQHQLQKPAPQGIDERWLKLRILLVEDNDDLRQMLRDVLELHGLTVFAVATGAAAVDIAREARPNVALVDVDLPDINGFEVARKLRDDARTSNIFLLCLSGFASEAQCEKSQAAGFNNHLTKPVSFEALKQELIKYAAII